jgi:hypothetical protein
MKFKTFSLLFFAILLWHKQLYGQCYWDKNQGINIKLASTIDSFNWRADKYYIFTNSNQTVETEINSPFTGLSNANDNIDIFIRQDIKDNDPLDGWELVVKNFGASKDPFPFPTLVLYNRYIGILRTFVYVPDIKNFSKNTAKIEIRFSYPSSVATESALLSPLQNPQFALDKFVKKIVSNNVQKASYFGGIFWMYADFPVSYDPCSCKHFTEIDVRPNFINIEKVDLTTATKTSTVMSGGSVSPAFSNIAQPFDYFAKGLEAGNKKLVSVGKSVGDISAFFNTYVLPNFDTKKTVLTIGPDDTNPTEIVISSSFRIPDFVKTNFGTVGTFLGLVEYFISGGKTTAMATPSVNYNITGTITDSITGQNTKIYVPGSPWAKSTLGDAKKSRPFYDNSLGVFSLIETPKSQRAIVTNQFLTTGFNTNTPSSFKVRLNKGVIEDLKYVINPSSNLVTVNISTSLVVTATFRQIKTTSTWSLDPINSGSANILEHKPLANPAKFENIRTFTCSSPTMSFDCLKDYVLNVSLNDATLLTTLPKIQLNVTLKNPTTGKLYYYSAQYRLTPDEMGDNLIPVNDFSKIPLNINLSQLNLTSDLTLKAWQNIKVSGNINTNGFKLNLISGGKVDIGNVSVTPNISIQIQTPADCGERTPLPLAPNLVQNFCTSVYNPIVPTIIVKKDEEDANSLKIQRPITGSLSATPNPFNNLLSIQYELQEPTQVTVSLSNALGQVVKVLVNEKVEAGNYQLNESTADLPTGVYIVSMKTPMGMKTQKVVKQNN